MRRHTHLMDRNGHYYFRSVIPHELIETLQRREVVISLQTRDLIEAKVRCAQCYHVISQVFLSAYKQPLETSSALNEAIKSLPFKQNLPRHKQALRRLQDKREENEPRDMLAYVFKDYIKECVDNRPKTINKKQATLDLWLDAFGDTPLKKIGKVEAREFKQLLLKLPANFTKTHKGKSIHSIDFTAIPPDKKLAIKSINIQIGYMRAFLNWTIQNGYYEGGNPFLGLGLKEVIRPEHKRHSFSEEQLSTIFSTPLFRGCASSKMHDRFKRGEIIIKDGMYWVPLIALYSGARMQEICQLNALDIRENEGVYYFDFNSEGDYKSLKNASSKRKTPIHYELINLGFLDYVKNQIKQGESRLFPDIPISCDGTYSNAYSKKFNHFLRRFNIKTAKTSFHSFRHTFIDALREKNVPRELRQAMVGHLNTQSAHDSYGSQAGLKQLYACLCTISFQRFIG